MSLPQFNNQLLQSFFSQSDFVEATLAQIEKDLEGLHHFTPDSFSVLDKHILETLVLKLSGILHDLSRRSPEQLSQFIYKVDLNESRFVQSLQADASLKDLAFLIIQREAQKVYLRKRFS